MERASIAAEVDAETKQELRIAAAERGISMSAYIRRAVENQLKRDQEGNVRQTPQTVSQSVVSSE